MPTDKYLKARKKHKCDNCDRDIEVGEVYVFGKGKASRYEEPFGPQVGISYYHYRLCLNRGCGEAHAPVIEDPKPTEKPAEDPK